MFLDKNEIKITNQYLENGYIIQPVADMEALEWMRSKFVEIVSDYLGISNVNEPELLLNHIHMREVSESLKRYYMIFYWTLIYADYVITKYQ